MTKEIVITYKLAFWFKYYVFFLVLFCALTGREPNALRLRYWTNKATVIYDHNGNKINTHKAIKVIQKCKDYIGGGGKISTAIRTLTAPPGKFLYAQIRNVLITPRSLPQKQVN